MAIYSLDVLQWNQSIVPCPILTVASWPAHRFYRRQVGRYSYLLKNFPQFVVIHTIKGFGIVNKAKVDFFWNYLSFYMIQWMLAIWSLVPLLFLNTAWTTESFQFMYYWRLAWRILSITLLACEMCAVVSSSNFLWHHLSLGLEWKLTFPCPVVIAEFSKFAGILSATLSQHHLLGFEIAQLEFHHLH